MQIDSPCPPLFEKDVKLEEMGNYFKTRLNELLPNNYKEKNNLLVRNIYTIDFPNIPLTEYPILKIYRNATYHSRDSNVRTSRISMWYSTTFQALKNLPGILNFVDYWIIYILREYQFSQEQMPYDFKMKSMPDSTDYLISLNDLNQPYFISLRWLISIEE
jgi:hypothetical protein